MTQPIEWGANRVTPYDFLMLEQGEETMPRQLCAGTGNLGNGTIRCPVLRARKTERITQVRMLCGSIAGIGITDAWLFAYEITRNNDGTWTANLVGLSADDPTMFSAATTPYQKSIGGFTKQQGHYYAAGAMVLGATTAPNTIGVTLNSAIGLANDEAGLSPPMTLTASGLGAVPQQTPAPGSIVSSTILNYAVLIP